MRAFNRGTFSTNGGGWGAIVINPFLTGTTTSYAGHKQWLPIMYTDGSGSAASWTGSATDDTLPSGMVSTFAASPYGSGSDSRRIRLVSAGLRVFYNGKLSDMGGSAVALATPSNTNLFTQDGSPTLSYASIANSSRAALIPISSDPIQVLYSPEFSEAFDYFSSDSTVLADGSTRYTDTITNFGQTNNFPLCMGVVINSTTANQSFRYDFVSNWEQTGQATVGQQLPAHADVQGMSQVLEYVQQSTDRMGRSITNSTLGAAPSMGERVYNNFADTSAAFASGAQNYLLSTAIPAVGAAAAFGAHRIASRSAHRMYRMDL